ncbi:hypothetical protein AB0C59_24015 [Streptomyces sp. NPDC048664]|uniref:hypothetical protein n=1 Tax=Streptomyces sp. NPDC048664 TaxID=3154505 RepID=UPI003427810B
MFAYEMHQLRTAELIREAENRRRVREARGHRRTARGAGPEPEHMARRHTHGHGARAPHTA